MLKRWGKLVLCALVALCSVLVVTVQPAAAKKTYTRTPTTKVSRKTYYSTSTTAYTYKANGNYKRWTFNRNHALKNYRNTIWTRSSKTYIRKNGKNVLYYYVRNSKNGASGWVWSGYLKPIKTYHRTPTTKVSAKTYYSTSTTAHTYKANRNYNYWTFKRNHDLKNYRNTIWTRSSKTYINKNGKNVLYYYVHNSKNGASGWVWSGYLKPIKTYHRTPTTKVSAKKYYSTSTTAYTYKANGDYNNWTFKRNHALKNYRNTVWTRSSKTYINKNGKNVLYYYVRNSKNGASGWVWNGYLKPVKATPKPKSEATLVAQSKVAKKAQQIVTVVQNGSSTATLHLWQKQGSTWRQKLSAASRIGSRGIGQSREGSSTTPIGAYHLSFAFGKARNAQTAGMPYRQIKSTSYWISDLNDRQYNTWQERRSANSKNEHLIDYTKAAPHNQYELAVVMDNHGQNNGSGFFIHVKNQWATAGCVSIDLNQMRQLTRQLGTKAYVINVQKVAQLANY
ncbi:hypothetical protein [Lactiplantibacillus plajomi]|uniref:L,D-TPase catalytic domain-containing protein n=1 Tax=Lactiplantibacillus plajomi TaxID=1457217 RepID=A0ABV6K702_9LACO|nr:hypothetical protein [Lactiplantibacillus plajomi]